MPKGKISNLADVVEALRPEYEAFEGGFRLKIEGELPGFVAQSELVKVNEELSGAKSTNSGLMKKVDELVNKLKTFDGIDPAKVKTLEDTIQKLQTAGVKDVEGVKAMIEQQLKPLQDRITELTTQNEASETARKAADQKVLDKELENTLQTVGIDGGIDPVALPDFLGRAKQTWKMVDGKPVAMAGEVPALNPQTGKPWSPADWVASLTSTAKHLFKTNSGGGAPGGNTPPVKTIPAGDAAAFLANVDGIAKGQVTPTPQQ